MTTSRPPTSRQRLTAQTREGAVSTWRRSAGDRENRDSRALVSDHEPGVSAPAADALGLVFVAVAKRRRLRDPGRTVALVVEPGRVGDKPAADVFTARPT